MKSVIQGWPPITFLSL